MSLMPVIQDFVLAHESLIRLLCFLVLFSLLLFLETRYPKRPPVPKLPARRINHCMLLALAYLATKLFVPLASYQVAVFATTHNAGLFNIIALPFSLNIIMTIVLFDLLIYLQHIAFHQYSWLWRVHRVHHSDLGFDTSTGIRFHPLEIVLSLCYKLVAVYLLGTAAIAIVLYEILLNSAALLTHSNIAIQPKFDKILRIIFITPDVHRVHHSVIRRETDSNYGNLFSIWDRLFKTYTPAPQMGHTQMTIGLERYRKPSSQTLLQLLKLPFVANK